MTDLLILDQPVLAPAFEVYGLCTVHPWKAALVKGQGKVPFDPQQHKRMVWAIDLSVLPVAGQDVKPIGRSMIQTSDEWKKVQASIQATGVAPSEVDKRYVKVTFEPTGETYVNGDGETKNKSYVHFVKIYPNEAECTNDYLASQFAGTEAGVDPNPGIPAAGASEFEAAKKLLEASIRSAVKLVKEPAEVKALVDVKVAASPVMSRFFNADSPELPDMIADALKG